MLIFFFFVGIIHRNLCGIERKPILDNNLGNFTRNITWSQILGINKNDKNEKIVSNVEEVNKDKSNLKKDTPILKVIAPMLKDDRDKIDDVIDKDQIVEKPKPKLTEPIKALKEKILDLKGDKSEQGNTSTSS